MFPYILEKALEKAPFFCGFFFKKCEDKIVVPARVLRAKGVV